MNGADKKAAQSSRVLRIYCEVYKKRGCEGCIFKPCYEYFSNVPASWMIPTPSRWTKGDKALADALRANGVAGARRVENAVELLKTAPSGRQWVVGVYDVSMNMFSDLKPGEYIAMADIISSKGERADDK